MQNTFKKYKKYYVFLPYLIFLPLIFYSVYLMSVSVLHHEINFFNDVARDFLLFTEVDSKKIVLIGPRSSTNNLFHGPLWTYINYPAYLAGSGNPIVVGWFWILLSVSFLGGCFYVGKKLFGTLAALVFTLLVSIRLPAHVNGIFHAEATIFTLPFLFFGTYKYITTKQPKYLILSLIFQAMLTHFNIGVGIQFIILSGIISAGIILKNRLWKHLLFFLLLPVLLSNFILFDIRHKFQMTQALFSTGQSGKFFISISSWIQNRIENTYSMQLFEGGDTMYLALFIFICVVTFSITAIKNYKNQRELYLLFFYYYLGYMAFSYVNKGVLLFHYTYLLIPLTLLWIASFIRRKTVYLFLPIALVIYLFNLNYSLSYVSSLPSFSSTNQMSWKGLSEVSRYVLDKQNGKQFGYYVFSPDSFAYQPRYGMLYGFKNKNGYEYKKMNTTYVIAAPAPANDPYMDYKWWVKVPVGITKKPVSTKKFSNGYTVLEYNLTPEEQKIQHDKSIELGIHFR